MGKKLKTPADYDQFSFRIDGEEKQLLMDRIDKIIEVLKENKMPDEYIPKKNGLILRALKRGLAQIEKEISKK